MPDSVAFDVIAGDSMGGEASFIVGNALLMLVSWVAADLFMANRSLWRKVLATVAGFPVVAVATVITLGNIGWLATPQAILLAAALAAVAMAARWSTRNRAMERQSSPLSWREPDALVRHLAAALLGGFGTAWVVEMAFGPTHFVDDDLSYHATTVAHWITEGRITLKPFSYTAYYPFNGESLALWFALPFRADGSAGLSGLYWGVLLVIASTAVLMSLSHSLATAMIASALLLSSGVIWRAARTFAAVDVAAPACTLAAIALLLPSSETPTRTTHHVDAAYAGLLAGFAVGCKITFAPIVPVLLAWKIWNMPKTCSTRVRVQVAVAFLLAATVTGSYWYLRTWILTGNPIFPAALGPFEGPLGAAEQARTKLLYWLRAALTDRSLWVPIARSLTHWPFGLFALAALGYGTAVWQCIRGTHSSGQVLLLAIGTTLLAFYPFMPMSGTVNQPNGEMIIDVRYIIAPFAIGIILFAERLRQDNPQRIVWLCLAVVALAISRDPGQFVAPAVLGGAAVSLWLVHSHLPHARPLWLASAALLVLALAAPFRQRLTDLQLLSWRDERVSTTAWQVVDRLPPGSKVSLLGPNTYMYYPTFGRRWQHQPIAIAENGTVKPPVYNQFRDGHYRWWSGSHYEQDADKFVSNLASGGIDYLLIARGAGEDWPQQHYTLEKSGVAYLEHIDGKAAVWRVRAN